MRTLDTISSPPVPAPAPLRLGPITLASRLILGTGKYANWEIMQQALDASGAEVVTVAVRRERLVDAQGRSLLDFLDTDRYTVLPNTAGCFSAEDAVRVARLGREILEQVNNPGRDWVKLEVLGDRKTLLPDPVGTLEACRELVADGFAVLCYTSDDPIMALRLRDAGATSVMPAGSPIGSGRGIANPSAIAMILEMLKGEAGCRPSAIGSRQQHSATNSSPTAESRQPTAAFREEGCRPSAVGSRQQHSATNSNPTAESRQPTAAFREEGCRPSAVGSRQQQSATNSNPTAESRQPTAAFPVIVDAGVGTPSDVTLAMELGADGVLLNTGIAHAADPVRMAHAMKAACIAGYHGARSGRIPRKMYASASSPWDGTITSIPGE